MSRSLLLPVGALCCAALSLFLLLWTVVPAPLYPLWLVALLASEWSLYIGVLGLFGVLLGLVAFRRRWRRTGSAAVVCGSVAFALSLYPPIAAMSSPAADSVHFSLSTYMLGSSVDRCIPRTFTFADVSGTTLRLDVYLPRASDSMVPPAPRRPAVVVVHGGSWTSGERSDFPQWNSWLVANGYAVFDIDYRLTPQPNWRTASDDVRAAVIWVKEHAARFGVDSGRVALMGRSAGGQLALIAAYTPRREDSGGADSRVRAVVAFYAPTDLSWAYDHPANQRVIDGPGTLRRFTGGTPEELPGVYAEASPVGHVDRESPPTFLVHGLRDQLVRPENLDRLVAAFRREGNDRCRALVIPYAQHGFDYDFNGWGSQMTRPALLDFLAANLSVAEP